MNDTPTEVAPDELPPEEVVTPAQLAPEAAPQHGPLLGVHLGVTESAGLLGLAPWPRLEAGWRSGRLSGVAELGLTSATARDSGTEPQPYDYTARLTSARVGLGGLARLAKPGEVVAPELGLSAQLHWMAVAVDTQVRGTDAGGAVETMVRPGAVARAGVVVRVGGSELPVALVLDVAPVGGDLAGELTQVAYGLSVGWRRCWSGE